MSCGWVQGHVGCRTRENQSTGGRAWPQERLELFLLLPASGTSSTPLLLPALNVSLGIKGRSGTGTTLGVPWVKGEGGGEDKAWSRGMGRGWWEIHGEGRGSTNALLSIPFLWVPEGHLALLGPYLTPRIHQEHQQQNAVTLPFLSLGGFHCFFHRNFFHKPKPHFLPPTTIDLLGSCNLNIRLSKEERDFMVSGLCVGQTGCSLALLHRLRR